MLIGTLACVSDGATTTAAYLSASDKIRLKEVLNVGWELQDLPSVHYAVLGYKLLGETVPKPQVMTVVRFIYFYLFVYLMFQWFHTG